MRGARVRGACAVERVGTSASIVLTTLGVQVHASARLRQRAAQLVALEVVQQRPHICRRALSQHQRDHVAV